MRILLVHNYYQQQGGEDIVFSNEADVLRQHGHEVWTYVEKNDRVDQMSRVAAATQTIWSRSSQHKLSRVLRDVLPELVHFHNTFMLISPSAYYACRAARVPIVQTLHNYRLICPAYTLLRERRICEDCIGKTFAWPAVQHGCWRGSTGQTAVLASMLAFHRVLKTWQNLPDVYIALTEFARRKFIQGGLPEEKIVVKSNSLSADPAPDAVSGLGQRTGQGDYALFVGRLSEEKGIQTLLDAWGKMKNIPLKIVGAGPFASLLESTVQQEGLGTIEILGYQSHENVLRLMRAARFFVCPSECYEGFPLTLAEALACGVPVITSRLGAMTEIIQDQHTGLHFTAGDAVDLAAKIQWAWQHSQHMREMGRNARAEYEQKYTGECNYQQLMKIYQLAIERDKEKASAAGTHTEQNNGARYRRYQTALET